MIFSKEFNNARFPRAALNNKELKN